MPLDKQTLTATIKATFKSAKEEEWTADQVAEALADAIDAFVKSGDVTGITTEVKDGDNIIGTGTQTGAGQIE